MGIESILLLVPSIALGITVITTVAAGYVMISCAVTRLKGASVCNF